jgi:hypothetical protein
MADSIKMATKNKIISAIACDKHKVPYDVRKDFSCKIRMIKNKQIPIPNMLA